MRSRNGCETLLLTICSIIFLFSSALNADEYLISYRYLVKDAVLYNESLEISHAMQECKGVGTNSLILESSHYSNIQKVILLHENDFINYIQKIGLNVEHYSNTKNFQNSSTTILTLKTTCFKVDFNDNFAKITALK